MGLWGALQDSLHQRYAVRTESDFQLCHLAMFTQDNVLRSLDRCHKVLSKGVHMTERVREQVADEGESNFDTQTTLAWTKSLKGPCITARRFSSMAIQGKGLVRPPRVRQYISLRPAARCCRNINSEESGLCNKHFAMFYNGYPRMGVVRQVHVI